MAAYGAVVSLKHTLDHLRNSSRISLVRPSRRIVKSAHTGLQTLQETLELIDSRSLEKWVIDLQAQIREAACRLEDVIESHVSNQLLSQQSEEVSVSIDGDGIQRFSIDLDDLDEVIRCFVETSKKMEKDSIREIDLQHLKHKIPWLAQTVTKIEEAGCTEELMREVYSSVISIKDCLYSSDIWLVPPPSKIIRSALQHADSLKQLIRMRLHSSRGWKRVSSLDGEIREAALKLQDAVIPNLKLLLSESNRDPDMEELRQETSLEEHAKELDNLTPEEGKEDDVVSSRTGSKIVGLSGFYNDLKEAVVGNSENNKRNAFISLVGMAGIGKTALARTVFEDPDIEERFNCCVWVKVGQHYNEEEIVEGILARVNPDAKMLMGGEEDLTRQLEESLEGKRFLIVLDDVWSIFLQRYLKNLGYGNGSRVLLTTRRLPMARDYCRRNKDLIFNMPFLNEEESWHLLREKVFVTGDSCSLELEKAGKKIAKNCEGLPLMIITVADLLSKAQKTPEYWNKIAETRNSIFMNAYNEISKVLYSSYYRIPSHMKHCFLYMGVFPQDYEIPASKLIEMWDVEGFLDLLEHETLEERGRRNLESFVKESLVMVDQKSSYSAYLLTDRVKTCHLHSSWWHLCSREAGKNMFFHVLSSCIDGLAEGVKSQRRLCIHNNILFGIKKVRDSMEDNCASSARSLLCFGPYHQYPVPLCFGLKLLRVLDALKIRFYAFPLEVLKLVQLRYLALTCNGELPSSISKLCNLHSLIVHRHQSLKSRRAPLYLPMQIWDMKELKHLEIVGYDLPNPCGASLENLLTLLNVSPYTCTESVLTAIPNLKKLGIQFELAPDDDGKHFHNLNNISRLCGQLSIEYVGVNIHVGSEFVPSAVSTSLPIFPSSLRRLSLNGLGYPWKEMSKIASLPNLSALKLRCNVFRGSKWQIEEEGFKNLKVLLIEDCDLVQWKVGHKSFQYLGYLVIKHCYKLKEIHWEPSWMTLSHLKKIEVVDCSPSAVKQIKETTSRLGRDSHVSVRSSWE